MPVPSILPRARSLSQAICSTLPLSAPALPLSPSMAVPVLKPLASAHLVYTTLLTLAPARSGFSPTLSLPLAISPTHQAHLMPTLFPPLLPAPPQSRVVHTPPVRPLKLLTGDLKFPEALSPVQVVTWISMVTWYSHTAHSPRPPEPSLYPATGLNPVGHSLQAPAPPHSIVLVRVLLMPVVLLSTT